MVLGLLGNCKMTDKNSSDSELRTLRDLEQRLDIVRSKVNQLRRVTPSVLEEKHVLEVEKFLDGILRKADESNEV
jgi:hypothetical protein